MTIKMGQTFIAKNGEPYKIIILEGLNEKDFRGDFYINNKINLANFIDHIPWILRHYKLDNSTIIKNKLGIK